MAITVDFHLHSSYSSDSSEPMENMVKSAIAKGMTQICFTEHMDFDFPIDPREPAMDFVVNTDSYLYELASLKEKYERQIKIFFGIELGLQPHITRELAVYAKSYDFDFIIGSTHVVNHMDPYLSMDTCEKPDEEIYREYFQAVLVNIKKFQNFDVCGHLDYIVRYGKTKDQNYSYTKYKDLFDEILTFLIQHEKGIEINTGSLRNGTKDVSPCIDILRRYKELGGEIVTIGSDAHRADCIGDYFNRAREALSLCGFQYYCIFQGRLPEYKKLL